MSKPERKAPAGIIGGECLDTTWETPPHLVALVAEYFGGRIPFDVCTSEENPCNADEFWTEKDDALSRDWPSQVWVNPPYGRSTKLWLLKFAEQARRGVEIISLLSAARFEQLDLQSSWQEANAICLIRKRVAFLRRVYRSTCTTCGAEHGAPAFDADAGPAQDLAWRCQMVYGPDGKHWRKRSGAEPLPCPGWVDPYASSADKEEVGGNTYANLFVGYRARLGAYSRVFGMAGACLALSPLNPSPGYLERRGQRAVTWAEGVASGLIGEVS